MSDKNIKTENEPGQPSYRHLTGKIARLPNDIREELNRRLLDDQPASDILPWLNELPAVKRILDSKFHRKPIKRQNLDYWRRTGYQFWLQQEQAFLAIYRISREARSVTQADCQALARGTATVVASRLFQLVQSPASEKYTIDDYKKIVGTVKPVLAGEHNVIRLKHEYERFRQRERFLILMRDKQQRDVVAIGRRLLGDEIAKRIEAAPIDNAAKIELIGLNLYGELWEPRPIPPAGPPRASENPPPQPVT